MIYGSWVAVRSRTIRSVAMVAVCPFSVTVIRKSTTANRVNNGENNEDDKAYKRGMSGIFFDAVKDSFLA